MNEFFREPQNPDDPALPVPAKDRPGLRTMGAEGLRSTEQLPVSADRGGRATGLASVADYCTDRLIEDYLCAMNHNVMRGGV